MRRQPATLLTQTRFGRLVCRGFWQATLAVLFAGALVSSAAADFLVTSLDEDDFGTAFRWGDFSTSGAVTAGPDSLTVNATDQVGDPGLTGGIGYNTSVLNFDASLSQWDVRFRVLPSNTASGFRLSYIDEDGGSSGTEYLYDIGIGSYPVNQWQTISQALASPSGSQTASGHTPGDGIQNPGLSQVQLQAVYGNLGQLNIEVDYINLMSLDEPPPPPPPYPGAEPDAPWRAEAATRIDALRKADLEVVVTDAAGNPLPNANVGVHMQKHEFGFGSAVQANRLAGNDPTDNTYKQKVEELFNMATVENHLKWPVWEGNWIGFDPADGPDAVDWLNARDIDVRGHVMVWPGYNNLPSDVQDILDGGVTIAERQQLRDLIEDHIDEIGTQFAGDLVAWDVVNEERTNNDVMNALPEGDGAMVDWFELARDADSGAKLYINEWGILSSSGSTNSANQNTYYNTINYLVNNNAEIDGIGFQAHFTEGSITGPEQIWTILDRFEELGLDMQITEFDVDTTNEELQAMYTRDFMTAVFAHEGMDDFVMWGFWEDGHWRPNAAMFRSDWSIKPNGEEYLAIVFDEWWTDEDVDADELGEAIVRAFKGEHEVSVSWGEYSDMVAASLTDGGLQLQIALPFLLGDYNHDDRVSAADYTVWRDSVGDLVEPGTGADGNHDGIINAEDYEMWLAHYGATMPSGVGSFVSVPEPASLWLLLAGVAGWWSRRTPKYRRLC
jgi:GH35 family endo-1,4-beta-xylanase